MEIALTKGQTAIIDDADLSVVAGFSWRISVERGGFYAVAKGRSAQPRMHRLIIGAPDGIHVDHANGNGLDNRRANLRLATHSQNGANRKRQVNNTSGFRGVSFHRALRKWQAAIGERGHVRYLGVFANAKDAALAYDRAAIAAFGEFARPNFPDGSEL